MDVVHARLLLAFAPLTLAACADDLDSTKPLDASAAVPAQVELDSGTSRTSPLQDAQQAGEVTLDATAWDLDAESSSRSEASSPPVLDATIGRVPNEAIGRLAEHACQHARHGPFRELASAGSDGGPHDLSRPHTAYRVPVGANASALPLVYVPRESGDYIVFASRAASWSTPEDEAGRLYDVTAYCDLAPFATLVALKSGESAQVHIGRSGAGEILLVVERLELMLDASAGQSDAAFTDASEGGAAMCRSSGPCSDDSECCDYCHDYDHCH